ncbi:MAG: hypothetical protein AB1578_08960 [Thermodesulfobacteriota bacterium]
MKHQEAPEKKPVNPAQASPHAQHPPLSEEHFAESLHSVVRRYAAEAASGAALLREGETPEVRLSTARQLHSFLEWLLARCFGEHAPPLPSPAFLGESERRLILETAETLGREILGPSPTVPRGRVIVRLVLDRCSGAPCAAQGTGPDAPPTCPGPDGGARRPGEVGHLCIGGPIRS